MKTKAISRRQFIQTGALTVGAFTVGSTLTGINGRSIDVLAQSAGHGTVYVPNLEIMDDGKSAPGEAINPLQSSNIWVVDDSSMPGPEKRILTPLQFNKPYFIIARVRNNGMAPVFNAYVNIYAARRSFGLSIPSDVPRAIRSFQLISSVITDVGVGETKIVASSAPWRIISIGQDVIPKGGGDRLPVVPWFVVVECFEPLTDPMPVFGLFPDPPAGATPGFNIIRDRHVASHIFSVRVLSTPILP